MKILVATLLVAVSAIACASVSFAECAGHTKTAVVTPPTAPAPGTSKT